MDLYGSGVSIGQANQQIDLVRQANAVASDFNNSLAEQLDQAKTAENEEQTDITTKNMASVSTSGLKLLGSAKARDDVANAAKKLKNAPSALASKIRGTGEAAEDIARPAGIQTSAAVVESSADVAEGAAQRGAAVLAGEGAEEGGTAILESGGARRLGKTLGIKSAEELGGIGLAKGAVAGLGGGLDIVKDIERGNFGSNPMQQVGNIGNIIGSGLEVAGLFTAWTPFGLGLEGLGAAISLGSAALETAGDIEEGGKEAEKTESDIQSQARGDVATDQLTTAVGRTQ